jgi:hypothetical protein
VAGGVFLLALAVTATASLAQRTDASPPHDIKSRGLRAPATAAPDSAADRPVGSRTPALIGRVQGSIQIDGHIREATWEAAHPLPMMMRAPVFDGVPTERTDVRIAYDAEALYVAARLYDRTPDRVRAYSLYRDRYEGGDRLGILLDAYNDSETGRHFWTTPAGIRGDEAISADGYATNASWDAPWTVATAQDAEGWTVEMRLPFASLGIQVANDVATMGLIVHRTIARKNEQITFPAISPGRELLSPSLAHDITLNGIQADPVLYVTPYLTGGGDRILQAQTGDYTRDMQYDAGFDLRYRPTNNLTLDVTANTDFAQVEADEVQINLTRFSLFFPEKRPFFQERAGLFEYSTRVFGADRLFYSRRIGLVDGRPVPIIGGAKLTGRDGPWDLGLMSLQTARQGAAPSENFAVGRVRRSAFNEASTLGALATSRTGLDGSYNVAYGLDADVRLGGTDFLVAKWAQTLDDRVITQRGVEPWASGFVQVQVERRQRLGFNYWLTATRSGPDFQPDMGFVQRTDFSELVGWVSYDWILGERTPIRLLSPFQVYGFAVYRNADRSLESALVEWDTDIEWDSGIRLSTDVEWHVEDLREPLDLPGATRLPARRYRFWTVNASVESPAGRPIEGEAEGGLSTFYDGLRWDVELEAQWNASRYMQMASEYAFTRVRFPALNMKDEPTPGFDAHLARWRLQTAVNARLSMDAFLQYASTSDRLGISARLRYTVGEGRDLWLVYDEQLTPARWDRRNALPMSDARALILKLTYTFGL